MKRETPAICADGEQTIEQAGAPGPTGRCEVCGESASVRPDDGDRTNSDAPLDPLQQSPRDPVVQRLRERYHEARALVSADESDPIHRGQLDWILGVHSDDTRSAPALDARTSELVVLWLEDLIRHLEELAAGDARLAGEPASAARGSQDAARALHAATREFAESFRRAANPGLRQ